MIRRAEVNMDYWQRALPIRLRIQDCSNINYEYPVSDLSRHRRQM